MCVCVCLALCSAGSQVRLGSCVAHTYRILYSLQRPGSHILSPFKENLPGPRAKHVHLYPDTSCFLRALLKSFPNVGFVLACCPVWLSRVLGAAGGKALGLVPSAFCTPSSLMDTHQCLRNGTMTQRTGNGAPRALACHSSVVRPQMVLDSTLNISFSV